MANDFKYGTIYKNLKSNQVKTVFLKEAPLRTPIRFMTRIHPIKLPPRWKLLIDTSSRVMETEKLTIFLMTLQQMNSNPLVLI